MKPLIAFTFRARSTCWLVSLVSLACSGVGAKPAPAPACDQSCQDGVALLALRLEMKFAFNLTVMGQPVGAQDKTEPCLPLGDSGVGSVHVFGDAESNADQGDSTLALSYEFKNCSYAAPPDPTADQNFSVTVTGLVTETGTLAQQPTAPTALMIQSDSLTLTGTVYDPPLDYTATDCALAVNQNGNAVAGTFCGRAAGFSF
ncbi:MAG TPA: hypothetical protein VK745_04020 [Polyangiaceae bacterium]|jgi:hypothetical protein|nr:hypothetical protein [Polyangiaceae bacterium]